MSLVKSNMHQLGQSATATQNFTLDASAANGTMKLSRGNAGATTQDILTISALGEVDFPQMIRNFGTNGYYKLAGGLILQWGRSAGTNTGTVTLPTAFPNACLSVVGTCETVTVNAELVELVTITPTSFSFALSSSGTTFRWQAIGY